GGDVRIRLWSGDSGKAEVGHGVSPRAPSARTAPGPERSMSSRGGHLRREMLGGTARVFVAELLILPTGLLITALLTRRLGTGGYGLFTLALTLVTWSEWSVPGVFARATIKFAAEAADWRPVGTTVVRLHLLVG